MAASVTRSAFDESSMIALVRHPKLRGTQGLCYGRRDFPLADSARDIPLIVAQLQSAGIGPAPTVFSSPAPRCRLVAERLAEHFHIDNRLQELDFGAWEGCAWDSLPRAALDAWAANPAQFVPPDGESGAALIARIQHFAVDLAAVPGDCVVVTHGGPLKVLSRILAGDPIDLLAPAPEFGAVLLFGVPPRTHDCFR